MQLMPYQPGFLAGYEVPLPTLPPALQREAARNNNGTGLAIDYAHHSLLINRKRKFAFVSASNIDGKTWQSIPRKGVFRKDTRQLKPEYQLGDELYSAIKSSGLRPNDFEEGHLTSFQEVLWGANATERKSAADDTFYFSNCVPQHARLNAGLWRSLEQYILKTQTIGHKLRVSVFTGPVLLARDPRYIKKINGQPLRIPCSFWKVIYYPGARGLNAVGFMMSQTRLLQQDGTVVFKTPLLSPSVAAAETDELFMHYKYDAVYQVRVELIQQITRLRFMLNHVHLPYQEHVSKKILYKRIQVRPAMAAATLPFHKKPLDYRLIRITL